MSPDQITNSTKNKLQAVVAHFQEELKKVRTGRAHPSMLDNVQVEAYGTRMPLIQVANVSAPESQLLQVTPFDPSNIQAISAAIRENPSLGMNPMDDGRVVRVPVPPLTEERRREYVKLLSTKAEESMVSLRGHRHDAIREIEKAKKDKQIGEDDAKRFEKQVDENMNEAKAEIDRLTKAKEAEIMTV